MQLPKYLAMPAQPRLSWVLCRMKPVTSVRRAGSQRKVSQKEHVNRRLEKEPLGYSVLKGGGGGKFAARAAELLNPGFFLVLSPMAQFSRVCPD